MRTATQTEAMDAFWMPFTANRQFKKAPRMLVSASGMYYQDQQGHSVLDGTAGLWCCNAGHGRQEIAAAISQQATQLDYAPCFQMGHPLPFAFAERLADLAPKGLDKVFFTNSGSESVDTALKVALAYQRLIGQGSRTRIIGREKAYHGVGFGGIAVGGLPNNRKWFGSNLLAVDHLPHTLDIARNAFSRGLPKFGIEKAEELENIIALQDPSTIAAVIVEPISGSAGVILPPPGYLKRLREITARHGILLIFDEVITGFGRVGAPFAATRWDLTPDIITTAKGLTNGTVPMGAVFISSSIQDAFMQGPPEVIDFFHGYTYSGHPLAAAAGMATLDVYQREELLTRALEKEALFADKVHSLKGLANVIDIRNIGLVAGIELAPREGAVGQRGFEVFERCFNAGALVRCTGDIIALSPPLIIEEPQMEQLVTILADAISATA
ncbi:omega-aminotransferase AptA [Gallaecimonas mangrovi]|uniref:aspartate aminotransferase family protein n=1 Tax=Gallaecimonas mangrovi TaxID=2291597 RepID=UPI001D01246A|nr:aspartate aminotransferase family protein [Gallaecimonas mangrovi]